MNINEIRIRNPDRWCASAQMENLIQNQRVSYKVKERLKTFVRRYTLSRRSKTEEGRMSSVGPSLMQSSHEPPDSVTYRSNIQVIYHKRKLFMETFKEYIDDVLLIEKSLSPIHNREQVFKAGEGAGSSGSFFFFSHDQKFIIKTMT